MRREEDEGFVCGTCGVTVYLGECRCTQPVISYPSPLLVKRERLDVEFDEIEGTV